MYFLKEDNNNNNNNNHNNNSLIKKSNINNKNEYIIYNSSIKIEENNNNNNNNELKEEIYQINDNFKYLTTSYHHYYHQYNHYHHCNNNIINNNNINLNQQIIKNNSYNENYIFLFCGDDHNNINKLYGFNINNKNIEKFKFKNDKFQKEFGTFRGSLFSISSTNESIYIFNGNKYLRYDLFTQKTYLISNNKSMIHDSSMYKSSFYDGKDNIYIVGGLLNGQLQENIYQWNIKTNEFVKYAKTNGPVLECQLCYSPKEDLIYMLGGWTSEHDYNQTIDVFNIKERTVTTIYKFNNKETLFSHSCYCPKNHSLYIYKWKINQFYRFDIKTKTIHPLPGCIKKTNFSRLLFDYNDSIYLPSNSSIYEYKCSLNKWFEHDLNINHKYLYTCHRI